MRHLWIYTVLGLLIGATDASGQCVEGPDAEAQRALRTAFEAQSAVSDHLEIAAVDRRSRQFLDEARHDERDRGDITAQASLNFGISSVRGFSVCDAIDWQRARLAGETLGAGASIGARDIVRLELRVFGVSDSIIQRDLSAYYPDQEVGASNVVPGATGAGHGVVSARLMLMDELALTVGRVSSHRIEHTVGWTEEVDDEGNESIEKSQTDHWQRGTGGRIFFAVGAPRLGTSDLIIGDGRIERVGATTPWIVARPRHPIAALRADVSYDGLIGAPTLGAAVMPLGGPFANPKLPTFRLRSEAELTDAVLREASIAARWSVSFQKLGLELPGELWALELESGIYGGQRLTDAGEPSAVPGLVARSDLAIPILAMLRLSAWGAINRAETINAVPDTVGRPEIGLAVYATYAR